MAVVCSFHVCGYYFPGCFKVRVSSVITVPLASRLMFLNYSDKRLWKMKLWWIASSLLCVFRWGDNTEPSCAGHAQHPTVGAVPWTLLWFTQMSLHFQLCCFPPLHCKSCISSWLGRHQISLWWKAKSCSGGKPPATEHGTPSNSQCSVNGIELKCSRPGWMGLWISLLQWKVSLPMVGFGMRWS